ncbi:YSIRK-type signal peptide-containing protein [Lactobacillaceae bacterium 24-114]
MGKNNQREREYKTVNQRQRFGFRKLSVGVASVMLGVTFLAGQELVAHADITGSESNSSSVMTEESNKQSTEKANGGIDSQANQQSDASHMVNAGANSGEKEQDSQASGNSLSSTNATTPSENSSATATTQSDNQYHPAEVTFTYYDKFTGKSLGYISSSKGKYRESDYFRFFPEYRGRTIGEFLNEQGMVYIQNIIKQIPGYKYSGDLNELMQTVITGDNQTLKLEYTRLSPIYVRYIDQTDGHVLAKLNFHVAEIGLPKNYEGPKAAPADTFIGYPVDPSTYTEIGDNYQANIPGYTYTSTHSPVTSGEISQTWNSPTDPNPIYIDFYYKVDNPEIAKYTREHPQLGRAPRFDVGPVATYITDKFNYDLANRNLKKYLTDNGVAYVGGIATYDSYLYYTQNDPYFFFLGNQDVKVNYINEATGEVMESVSATPSRKTTVKNKNPYFGDWTSEQKSFDNLYFDRVDRPTSGKYGIFAQEVNYYYLPVVSQRTEKKTVKRIIHFVADNANFDQLQDNQIQNVTYSTTYFSDQNGNIVNVKRVQDKDGKWVYIADPSNTNIPQKVWTVSLEDEHPGVAVNNGQGNYDKVQQDQIDIPNGALKGTWKINRATFSEVNGPKLISKYAPQELISNDIPDGTVENVYLIYNLEQSHEVTPPTPENPGEDQSHEVTPSTPENPGEDQSHEVTPPTPDNPGEDQPHEVTPSTPKNPEKETPREETSAGLENVQVQNKKSKQTLKSEGQSTIVLTTTRENNESVQTKLPQTGSKSGIGGLVGLGLASFATMWTFGTRKKKY